MTKLGANGELGSGEILLIIAVAFILLSFTYVFLKNIQFTKKEKKKAKEKKDKDVQPVADLSPTPINRQSSKGKEEPLNVDDPIFNKDNVNKEPVQNVDIKDLIEKEKERENKNVLGKLDKIQITSEPITEEEIDFIEKKLDIKSEDKKD